MAGTWRIRPKTAEAVTLAKLHPVGEVDRPLGIAAITGRFVDSDLIRILTHNRPRLWVTRCSRVRAENHVRAGQAAYWYSWMRPPSRSRRHNGGRLRRRRLRIRLGISATQARRLVKIIRAEFQAQTPGDPAREDSEHDARSSAVTLAA